MRNPLAPVTATMPHQGKNSKRLELAFWIIVLAIVNFPLLTGDSPELFTLDLQLVKMGQFWRIVTHPFAHLSIYHLVMDASAFLMLYAGLEEKKTLIRVGYTAACGFSSLLFSLAFSHSIATIGLSGLSGIAHGLMAITAMELIKKQKKGTVLFNAGVVILSLVILKSIFEVWTGQVVLSGLHIGMIGVPVVEAHLGGVIGGIGSFMLSDLLTISDESKYHTQPQGKPF